MSDELRSGLEKVVEEEKKLIEGKLELFKDLLLRIRERGVWNIDLWVEGTESEEALAQRDIMLMLEKAGFVQTVRKYTHRNALLEGHLTEKGKQIAEELRNSKS